MKVTMHFDGTDPDERFDFTLLCTAFNQRGGAVGREGQTLSTADRRSDATIKRALYAMSEPVLLNDVGKEYPAPKPGEPDLRPRQLLTKSNLELVLEQPEFSRLVKFFDAETMVWFPGVVDRADEVSQRLTAALASAAKKDDTK